MEKNYRRKRGKSLIGVSSVTVTGEFVETQGLLVYLKRKKTTSCKKATKFPGWISSLIGQKKSFFWLIIGTNSKISGTGSVRVSS